MWRNMRTDPPPNIGNSIVWHWIKYKNGNTALGCWWGNHWYQNMAWMDIVEWQPDKDWEQHINQWDWPTFPGETNDVAESK